MQYQRLLAPSRYWALFGALALALAMAITAQAQDVNNPTSAEITGTTDPPEIECTWILPDMIPGNGSHTVDIRWGPDGTLEQDVPVGNVDYENPSHVHDDDPSTSPTPWPCFLPGDGRPEFNGTTESLVTVRPNLENLPEERAIELWTAVDHTNGISNIADVYWRVFHPDGTFKLQVHGERVSATSTPDCDDFGTSSGPSDSMFHAAHHTGQLEDVAIDDLNWGMISLCQQEVKAFYHVTWPLSKDQQCGQYRVETTAVSSTGSIVKQDVYFFVPCVYSLQVDFDSVDWGGITPGLTKILAGNLIWGDGIPTVKNVGNDGMGLIIEYSELIGVNEQKVIDEFDAKYGRSPSTLFSVDMSADTPTLLSPDTSATPPAGPLPERSQYQVLCANELGKLDLSVHPPTGLPADTYVGEIYLTGYHLPGYCLGNQQIFNNAE